MAKKTKHTADRPNRRPNTERGEHWDEMAAKPGWLAHLRYGMVNRKHRRRHWR